MKNVDQKPSKPFDRLVYDVSVILHRVFDRFDVFDSGIEAKKICRGWCGLMGMLQKMA